eukprot:scaffold7331_cov403-Prasinococcus_capsulatus_cf.AAC.2
MTQHGWAGTQSTPACGSWCERPRGIPVERAYVLVYAPRSHRYGSCEYKHGAATSRFASGAAWAFSVRGEHYTPWVCHAAQKRAPASFRRNVAFGVGRAQRHPRK